ncbi:MAG: T9SS type A sorting domain-containing protein [Chitinophagales bacterium]
MAEHNHWQTGGGPPSGYLIGGFDEDIHPCTMITYSTACYIETKPTNCACNYDACAQEDCAEELTEEEITLRLAATSCNTTIPKLGGVGTVTVAQQFRNAYLLYLDGDYNYAYQNFNHLKNKVNQNYPQGLSKGVCNALYKEAVMYVELCSLIATVHCQSPFYTERLAEEYSNSEFEIELYPNPTNTTFNLFTSATGIITFSVFDIAGSEIITNNFESQTQISVLGWPSGIYLVYLKNETTGLSTAVKLVVE